MVILFRVLGGLMMAVMAMTANSSDLTSQQLLFDYHWKAAPKAVSQFAISKGNLKQQWAHFHRATKYPFPDARYLSSLFKANAELKSAIPKFRTTQSTAATLQSAWVAFFRGEFQKAAQLGYGLGPIGHGVAFYSQVTYASRLESDERIRHQLWEDVMQRHELSKSLTSYDAMTRFFAFFAMARLSEEIAAPLVLTRGYLGSMKTQLDELIALEPYNVFGLAARASMDAGIVRKMGKIMGRLTYGADAEVVSDFYSRALAENKLIPNVHLEYAQSLLYMHGKKKLEEAIKHMTLASSVVPQYTMEALDVNHAKRLLAELLEIQSKNGYGLRDYVKRNTDKEKKYYFANM